MQKISLVSLAVLAAVLAIAGAAPASDGLPSGAFGFQPTRDGGHGHWFARACALPAHFSASCSAQVVSDENGQPLVSSSPPSGSYGPTQFHEAYALPTAAPSVQTVGIVDAYDDPSIASDLAAYDAAYGLPSMASGGPGCSATQACFEKVNESGGSNLPAANSGWALEISLDVETVQEICQNCNIILVEASSATTVDLGLAENEAVKLGANVVSNSWGAGEYQGETQDTNSYFNHPGVAITASAGDSGYGVEFPAASPDVTAVGGTLLTLSGSSYGGETVWSGSGSGCSSFEPKPAWQSDSGCGNRTVADVSADADPNTGAAVYDSYGYGGWLQVGGTSLSAQLIAGVYALTGQASKTSSGSTPYLDSHRLTDLHDVTSGSNGSCSPAYLCNAALGYDGPTGLGSPDGLGAFTPVSTPDFSLTVSPSSQTLTSTGGTASYTVTLTPLDGFTGSVSLALGALPAGVTNSASSSTTVSAASPGTLALVVAAGTAAGSHPLSVTGTAGSESHSAAFTLVITGAPTPSFTLSASPMSRTVGSSGATTYTVTITPANGFAGVVNLTASGLPSRSSAAFSPPAATTSSTLTVTTSRARRAHATITITGSSGALSAKTTVALVVT